MNTQRGGMTPPAAGVQPGLADAGFVRTWPGDTLEANARTALLLFSSAMLLTGLTIWWLGTQDWAKSLWSAGTLPVALGLLVSMVREILAGRTGVDAIAFVSMTAAVILGEPLAANIVAIMYAGGNVLEDFAVGRAKRNLKALVDRAPRIAHRLVGSDVSDIPVSEVALGDSILVQAGEIVPVDGTLTSATALLDLAALTGEPLPVTQHAGDLLRSGGVNSGESFTMRATATAGESTYAGIVRMATAAQTAKAPFIRLADRYALLLLPLTLGLAGVAWLVSGDPVRGLAVLVAATPCPLILAAPVALVAGVSQAARNGILVKGAAAIEALARVKTVMFDKTGTLTVGGARLISIESAPGEAPDDILRAAASLEQASHNVVAASIVEAARSRGLSLMIPVDVRETMGSGLEGRIDGKLVRVGSHALVHGGRKPEDWALHVLRRASWRSALSVFVSRDGRTIGALLLGDEIRRETPRAVHALREAGVTRIVMITGDRADAADTIAAALDLDAALADRVPSDKVDAVTVESRLAPTLMVGDGINDAPALAAADVGVAMGARGASASSEAADVVILVDRLDRVAEAVRIAQRARRIAIQSIVVGMSLSGVAMGLAAFGWLSPIAGALTQEAIDVAVILNALRALSSSRSMRLTTMPQREVARLRQEHESIEPVLDRLRVIADQLDAASPDSAVALIQEANAIASSSITKHEQDDERSVYPGLGTYLSDGHGLAAMSRAHREILHLSRMLGRIADGLVASDADRHLIRDAQRVIESIEALVRLHNAQEEDIYEHAAAG